MATGTQCLNVEMDTDTYAKLEAIVSLTHEPINVLLCRLVQLNFISKRVIVVKLAKDFNLWE